MRVLIVTVGATGDVAPYTGLGARLAAAGHQVAIAVLRDMTDLVTAAGLEPRALPIGARASDAAVGPARQRTGGARDGIRTLRVLMNAMDTLNDGIVTAAEQGTDVIVSHSMTMLPSACVAEALSIPMVAVPLAPLHPTGSFPPLLGIPSLGRRGNRLAHRGALGFMLAALSPSTRRLRRRLGLRSQGAAALWDRLEASALPVCNAVSPTVIPRPPDWRPDVGMVGYLWPSRPASWAPPAELVDFLAAGPPPVYVGFGSLGLGEGGRLSGVVADALRRAGVRGVVHSGWAQVSVAGDDMITIGHTPHDWLFPQMAAVVHHAGAGTTAAILRAGVPSVPVPVTLDQPFWARRLHDLGVTPAVLPYRRLRAPRLAEGIRMAVDGPAYRTRAAQLATTIHSEDGAGAVIAALEKLRCEF